MAPDGSASSSAQSASSSTPAFQPDAVYSPTGDFYGNFPSASAAAAAPSPMAFNAPASGSDPRTLSESDALVQRMTRLFNGVGQLVGNSLVSPAEAAPLPRIPSGPTAPDLPDDEAPAIVKKPGPYLSGRVVYPSPPSPGDASAPATPNVQDSFNDRFGDWVSSPAGTVPRGPTEPAQAPQAAAPPGLLTGQRTPRELIPHWMFGLPDSSKATGDSAEDWLNRWIRPYLER